MAIQQFCRYLKKTIVFNAASLVFTAVNMDPNPTFCSFKHPLFSLTLDSFTFLPLYLLIKQMFPVLLSSHDSFTYFHGDV